MKVDVQVRGLEELKCELARLDAALPEPPEIVELRRAIVRLACFAFLVGAWCGLVGAGLACR
jgi:hypothetical protein